MLLARVGRYLVWGAGVAGLVMLAMAGIGSALGRPLPMVVALTAVPIACAAALLQRRPGELAVAQHVDDALGLRELLSSTIAVKGRDDEASAALRATAEGAAKRIDARQVDVGTPNGRTLAVAMLGLALSGVITLLTRSASMPPAAGGEQPLGDSKPSLAAQGNAGARTSEPALPADRDNAGRPRVGPPEFDPARPDAMSTRASVQSPVEGRSNDAGRDAATTSDRQQIGKPAFSAARGETVEGDAPASAARGAAKASAGEAISSGRAERAAIAAGSARTVDGQAIAREALRRGDVPDRARDLVRAYFDVPAGEGASR